MMSCGICNKWQHIICHDSADLRAGRRKRNWDIEEFVCQRCRSRGSQKYETAFQPRQYSTQSSGPHQQPHTPERLPHIQPTANFSTSRTVAGYAGVQGYTSSTPSAQNGHDNFLTSTPSASMTQQQPYQPLSAITFAHYQPDQAGFSTRQTYQRDLPGTSYVYQQPPQYIGRSSQQLQPEVTNLRPVQVRKLIRPCTYLALLILCSSHKGPGTRPQCRKIIRCITPVLAFQPARPPRRTQVPLTPGFHIGNHPIRLLSVESRPLTVTNSNL
jgi:uncharacterized protein YlaI